MFCPKCGTLLGVKTGKDGKKALVCGSCDYTSENTESMTAIKEKVTLSKEEKVIVIEEDTQMKTLPLTDQECPKCSHLKAYFWTVQTRAADEPETKFFKCEKCNHTWRDYD